MVNLKVKWKRQFNTTLLIRHEIPSFIDKIPVVYDHVFIDIIRFDFFCPLINVFLYKMWILSLCRILR